MNSTKESERRAYIEEHFSFLNERKKDFLTSAAAFFEGRLYPLIMAAIVLVGHVLAIEMYLNIFFILSVSLSLLISKSSRAFVIALLSFLYQINLLHVPKPNEEEFYYAKLPNLIILITLSVILLTSLGIFVYRNVAPKIKFKTAPLLLPLAILSASFLLNGVFSSEWHLSSLIYGFFNAFIYFFLFYVIYYGLENEEPRELLSYACYITLLLAGILIGEMAFMYLTYDNLIVEGEIIKEAISLGWGIYNPMGFAITSLIPLLILGAMKERYWGVYLAAGAVCWLCAIATLSRNAMIFATLTFAVSVIVACFRGERRRAFRIITLAGILSAILLGIILFDKISATLADFISRGFGDNGRFDLWEIAFEKFKSAPVFGVGFFGYGDYDWVTNFVAFLPDMAHNTVFQLLGSMGVFGLISYLYYRYKTLLPLIKAPTTEKTMLYMPVFVLMLMSLLDNFVFYFYTVFYYIFILSVIFIIVKNENNSLQNKQDSID